MRTVVRNPKPTISWFDENKELKIDKIIHDFKVTLKDIDKETNELLIKYNKDILSIDYKNMLKRFYSEYANLFKYLKGSYSADRKIIKGLCKDNGKKLTDDEIIKTLNKITLIKEKEQWILDNKSLAMEMLGGLYIEGYTNWDIIESNRADFKAIKTYFNNGKISEQLKKVLLETDVQRLSAPLTTFDKIAETDVISFLLSIFKRDIGESKVDEILTKISQTIDFSIGLKKDYAEIFGFIVDETQVYKYTVRDIVSLLTSIKCIKEKRNWFSENNANLNENFGEYYIGEKTNWEKIKIRLEITEQIIDFFGKQNLPNQLISYLVSSDNSLDDFSKLKLNIENIGKNNIKQRLSYLLNINENQTVELNELLTILEKIENDVTTSKDNYADISNCCKIDESFENIMSGLANLNRIQEIEEMVKENNSDLSSQFEFKFNGMNTDWEKIILSLNYANKFKEFHFKYSLSDEYLQKVCSNKSYSGWLSEYSGILKTQDLNIKSDFEWYANLFDDKDEFYNTSLYTVLNRIEESLNNLTSLEEWIDYRSIRQQCRDIGISDFVNKVENVGMKSEIIQNTFFKRFYRLWIDAMIQRYPAVYAFRGRTHQSIITDFRALDKEQLQIARLRILERLIQRVPNSNFITSSVDEVGILKRELTKQKKIKPLRRLFKEIPNLLTSLKPCLMMSPLSVSLYLQADGYNFDIVIFDEASQVCTEDAIGAIMRGNQVIIAGDSKQLPPTNFFMASLSDGDFDTDSDDEDFDDIGAYDSILEEATNAIPERTLKWHYRSRHEHLIAFSNAKIYNHELITFPSNIEKVVDNGVEYIYVENGVYDRGGKKHNLNEAKRVAELVFTHFRKYPNRSLGVVTFSEAQQQAIDGVISQFRSQNGQYEQFFLEDTEQAFFIKNLENVQGDERDTIIFSIGYAKDQNGVMYMNFGPLSRNGGHRRLNVAITRAKYNVKLVGSIHPTDIRTESTNAEGVKMLRQYIEFAINGQSVLQNELKFTNIIDVESPFEEAVCDFLIKNGYNVTTQVGCSGYRIDMAVKHPTLSGIFVLGIECDGATYHSARTARERDRLRQTVLEDIGWKIYRIWSTDWIKDTKTEGSKLLEAVEMAITNYKIVTLDDGSVKPKGVEEKDALLIDSDYIITPTDEEESETEIRNPYSFAYYKETDVYEVERVNDDVQFLTNVIKFVVEQEFPIHYELLCKRVAPLFGNQKATVKVRNAIDNVLGQKLKDIVIKKEGFCWYKDTKEIQVKIPPSNGDGRSINYICTEELAEAMFAIVGKSFGIARNDLYIVTARTFGFNRMGGNITVAMEKACLLLLEICKVKEVDGKIVT